jgi:hypothetical protein
VKQKTPRINFDQFKSIVDYCRDNFQEVCFELNSPVKSVNGKGLLILKIPSIVIDIPQNYLKANYLDTTCILFHELGHYFRAFESISTRRKTKRIENTCESNLIERESEFISYTSEVLMPKRREMDGILNDEQDAWNLGLCGLDGEYADVFKTFRSCLVEVMSFPSAEIESCIRRYKYLNKKCINTYK